MDSRPSTQSERERRFRDVYDGAYSDLLRFVRRRVHPSHADDVVGEVMLVAWRRLDDIPVDGSAARAWLFGVARKTLQNTRRREERQAAVAIRLLELPRSPAHAGDDPDLVACRIDLASVWTRLGAADQEALSLAVLDGLSGPEAAAVLAISPAAFRLRLSRARRTLRRHLDTTTDRERLPSRPADERSPS